MPNVAKLRGKGNSLAHHHTAITAASLGEVCFERLCQPGPLYPAPILRFQRAGDESWHRICPTCKELESREAGP